MSTEHKDGEQTQPAPWQEQILPFINLLDEKSIEFPWMTGDMPQWVTKAIQELLKAIFPDARLKEGPNWTPREVGTLLGQMLGHFEWLADENGFAKSQAASLLEKSGSKLSSEEKIAAKAEGEKIAGKVEDYLGAFFTGLPQILAATACADSDLQKEFFTAYATGLSKGKAGLDIGTYGTTATPVYIFLAVFWRSVIRLDSVAALHKASAHHLGAGRAGSLKTFQKLCQRIGLKLRKPGRPRKVK